MEMYKFVVCYRKKRPLGDSHPYGNVQVCGVLQEKKGHLEIPIPMEMYKFVVCYRKKAT